MSTIVIKKDRYYSDGKVVRHVTDISEEGLVAHNEAHLTKSSCGAPDICSLAEFQEWAKYEVMPTWSKVARS